MNYLRVLYIILIFGLCTLKAVPIFYYYTGMDSSDGIIYNAVDVVDIYTANEEPARSTSGWGYTIPKTACFSTDSSSIRTDFDVTMSYIGVHTFSGELWVRPYQAGGVLWTWGDTTSANYFRMSLNNDFSILLERNLLDSCYSVTSTVLLDSLGYHYIRWISEVSGDTLYQTLRINNNPAGTAEDFLEFGTGFTILRSPVIFGGNHEKFSRSFQGEIHAYSLTNAVSEYEIKTYVPFDGSQFSGIPYFSEEDFLKNYTISPTPINKTIFVPYIHDDFIPQGLTNSYEDPDFTGSDGMIYISSYYKNVEGTIALKRSLLIEIDPTNNYQVRRCFRLKGQLQYGHNGGIAFKNNIVYISGSGYIEAYQIPAYEGAACSKYQDISPIGFYNVEGPTSFTCYFNDTLWVGDFREEGQSTPYIRGYRLNSNGSVYLSSPKYYRLPLLTQGATWGKFGGQSYLFTSHSSGGTNNSILYRFSKRDLSVMYVAEPQKTFEFPSGAEDISFDNEGDLWCVSESGARYYQLRESSPWKQFFPFIYETKNEILFGDIDTTLGTYFENRPVPDTFDIFNYPNPFNNSTTIEYSLIKDSIIDMIVYDICGREVTRLINGEYQRAGKQQIDWNSKNHATGIYYIRLCDQFGNMKIQKSIYLK